MSIKKGSYSKVSSSKTAKKKSSQVTQKVTKKRPTKAEFIAYLQKHRDFIFERGWWYREIGRDSDYKSDVKARTEKGIKVHSEWYPKRFIVYHDNTLYAPYWLILDKRIKNSKQSIEQMEDENLSLKDRMNDEVLDEFSSMTSEEFRASSQQQIKDNIDYIKQYQKSIVTDQYFKDLIDER